MMVWSALRTSTLRALGWRVLCRGAGNGSGGLGGRQLRQGGLDALITGGDPFLIRVIERDGLLQGKEVLGAVIPRQGAGNGLQRGFAADIAIVGQFPRIARSGQDGADNPHPGLAGDVGDRMVQLQVHRRQRLLHVLDRGGGVIEQALTLAQVGAQRGDVARGMKAAPQQAVGMQRLEPLGIVDVGLAPGDVFDVARVGHDHADATGLEDLVEGDPIDPGRLHRHGVDTAGHQPLGEAMQIARKALEGPHRLGIPLRRDGHDMELGANVDARRLCIERRQRLGARALRGWKWLHGIALGGRRESRAGTARSITVLFGIAQRRHHTQTRNSPRARFFDGVGTTKKQTASALEGAPTLL